MKTRILNFALVIFGSCLMSSCKDDGPKQQNENGLAPAIGIALDPRLKETDSLVVVFYKDPYGEDSLRYTRFYTQVSVTGKEGLTRFEENVKQTFRGQEKRRNCRSEGKIWCFTKGKVFQTIYFSNRCDDCCHLYLIKNGNFYYSRISPEMTSWLAELKPLSIEPSDGGVEE